MKRALDVLGGLAMLAGFAAGMGALGAWALSKVLPWSGGYAHAALWGLAELGFVGLVFLLGFRTRIGLAVFFGSLAAGALWGLACLGGLRLCGATPGPYVFSMTFAVSTNLLAFAVVLKLAARREKTGV